MDEVQLVFVSRAKVDGQSFLRIAPCLYHFWTKLKKVANSRVLCSGAVKERDLQGATIGNSLVGYLVAGRVSIIPRLCCACGLLSVWVKATEFASKVKLFAPFHLTH